MITSWMRSRVSTSGSSSTVPSERNPFVGTAVSEMTDQVDLGARALARALGHLPRCAGPIPRAPPGGGSPARRAGAPCRRVGERAQGGDVDRGEDQRAVEDVVAREVLPVGQREHERDDRRPGTAR